MSATPKYPLEKIVEIRKSKLDKAERALKERKDALVVEEEKLQAVKGARDKVKELHTAKLLQLRQELDQGTTTVKIQRFKTFISIVDHDLKEADKKVAAQRVLVKDAEKRVEEARADYVLKQRGLEKFSIHKKIWEEEQDVILMQEEELRNDEAGTVSHARRALAKKHAPPPPIEELSNG